MRACLLARRIVGMVMCAASSAMQGRYGRSVTSICKTGR